MQHAPGFSLGGLNFVRGVLALVQLHAQRVLEEAKDRIFNDFGLLHAQPHLPERAIRRSGRAASARRGASRRTGLRAGAGAAWER